MMRQLTAEEFAEIANLIIKGPIDDAKKAIAKDSKQTALRVMIASVAKVIHIRHVALDTLLNRLRKKVKERVEVTGANGAPQVIAYIPDNGKAAKEDKDAGNS